MRTKTALLLALAATFLLAQTTQAVPVESVPDAGTSASLLAVGLAALALIRRKAR